MCQVVTRKDRHSLGEKPAFLVRHIYPTVEVCESVERCAMSAMRPRKACYPQKTRELWNKAVYRRLSNELNSKTKIFCFEMEVFIHGICMCEGVIEGSGHWHNMITFM